jgi:hypothetical protein
MHAIVPNLRLVLVLAVVACLLCSAVPARAEIITLQAEDFMAGGKGVGYWDDDVRDGNSAYRDPETVDINETDDGGAGLKVGWTNGGEWLILTTDPGTWTTSPTFAGGVYYAYFRVASGGNGGTFRVEVDGQVGKSGVGGTGGWDNWATRPSNAIQISAGQHDVKFLVDGGFDVNYIQFSQDAPVARTLGVATPTGSMGKWGVREVYANGNQGNLDSVVTSLNSGTGTIVDYQASVVNIHDSDNVTNTRLGNRSPFGVVTQGHATKGNVENLALVAGATVKIPTTGWYTFDVNSDDGFELSIDGNVVHQADWSKGADDQLGQAYLTAGNHNIRLLYWEGGGGSSVQVSAAPGYKTSFDGTFNLIGAPALPAIRQTPPSITNTTVPDNPDGFDVVVLYNTAVGLDGAVAAVRGYWAGTYLPDPPRVGTAVSNTINYRDPDDGWEWIHGKQMKDFPGTVGGDGADDNFVLGARGTMHVSQDGVYTFFTFGDDGSQFRIVGMTDPDWLDRGCTGGGFSTIPEGFKFDGWNENAWGTIDLAAGDYDLELIWKEGGGGAHVGLFAKYGVWGDVTNPIFLLGDTTEYNADAVPAGLEIVPEPATMILLGFGVAGLVIRRRRSSRAA